MPNRKWTKSPASHVEAFAAALPTDSAVERRSMFGYPCAFVNGNMFCGLHEGNICARLGVEEASRRIASGKAAVFAPMIGRVMKEYVAIPVAECTDPKLLRPWLTDALRYTAGLPAKVKKPAPSKTKPEIALRKRLPGG
jgi:TfoX/Sxy family transcriptional regulator of competence genes